MKIKQQIQAGFLAVLLIMLGSIGFGSFQMSQIENRLEDIVDDDFTKLQAINALREAIREEGMAIRNLMLMTDPEIQSEMKARVPKQRDEYAKNERFLRETVVSAEGKSFLHKLDGFKVEALALNDQTLELLQRGKLAEASAFFYEKGRLPNRNWLLTLDAFRNQQMELTNQVYGEAKGAFRMAIGVMVVISVVALLAAFWVSKRLACRIYDQLGCEPSEAAEFAERLAAGDLSARLDTQGKPARSLVMAQQKIVESIAALVAAADSLVQAAVAGRLDTRAELGSLQGEYRKIVEGVNRTMDYVVGYLDNMPLPAMVISKEREVLYMNKRGAELGASSKSRLLGQKCFDHFNTGDCHSGGCACLKAMASNNQVSSETVARPGNLELDIKYIGMPVRNLRGEITGAFEVVMDETDIKKAQRLAKKIADFQSVEAERAGAALRKLAVGDLDIQVAVASSDKDTEEAAAGCRMIADSIEKVVASVGSLIEDSTMLSNATLQGNLQARAEEARHQGDYRRIVQGMNDTLSAVAAPIVEVVRVLGALARGDLTERITADYKGTFAALRDDANVTVENLSRSVESIREATDAINTASREIAMGNADLSQRTEEQASSLEETASSMEELASTVKQNADNARQANQMAVAASDVAVRGGDVVQQVVGTMNAINESSRKIVDIISVIDGIAFQTNILALNAAVEAARAGEQGRGFAVVAGEVRNLAQRSAAAAKEIKTLIGDSVEKVEDGAKLVSQAGRTMDEIVSAVKRVTDIMSEIAAASVEQSSGIEQVNQAVTQMDETTQQNAALVEEAAAAAESLEEQAGNLAHTVAQFRLDQQAVAPGARPKPARQLPNPPKAPAKAKGPSAKRALLVNGPEADDWTEF
ncbi:methyl-accepting chemotaxis protein [Methyloterricola oryzae]|uniref:methyl-accepting chemotaxis protein n=1 Tax=Methyloterricola oryzae TaxID=1495050 RepID=UPI0009E32FB8|nr:methyl-accepting chemotaxis protein [Methyloterricola oryzae]